MENKYKMSLIIPVYNGEKYIRSCLDSILVQKMPELEVVLVDDGSTDSTGAILAEYCKRDGRFHLLCGNHEGVAAARNKALDYITGEYVAFIDGDDHITEDYCEALYELASATHSDMVSYKYLREYAGGKYLEWLHFSDREYDICNEEDLKELYIGGFYEGLTICNHIYSRQVIEENRLRFEMNVGEDVLFNLRMLCLVKHFVQTSHVYYYYVQRASSAIHNLENPGQGSVDIISKFCDKDSIITKYTYAVQFTGLVFCEGSERISKKQYISLLAQLKELTITNKMVQAFQKGTLKILPGRKVISYKFYYFEKTILSLTVCGRLGIAAALMEFMAHAIYIRKRRKNRNLTYVQL